MTEKNLSNSVKSQELEVQIVPALQSAPTPDQAADVGLAGLPEAELSETVTELSCLDFSES